MSFPTLDTHGHKTIKNLADCYHMSVIKSETRYKEIFKIVKNKATFKYYPNYERINRILRGRPIFHRIDQNLNTRKVKNQNQVVVVVVMPLLVELDLKKVILLVLKHLKLVVLI